MLHGLYVLVVRFVCDMVALPFTVQRAQSARHTTTGTGTGPEATFRGKRILFSDGCTSGFFTICVTWRAVPAS